MKISTLPMEYARRADPQRSHLQRVTLRMCGVCKNQSQLAEAGRHGDFKAAEIIEEGRQSQYSANRYSAGNRRANVVPDREGLRQSIITVAEEHRFTAFCEHVFESIVTKPEAPRLRT